MTQTISDALHTATLLLARTSASARLDAELLLEYVTGLSRTDFRAAPERALPAAAGWSFQQLIRRRLQGEPVAYIRGHQEFWSLLLEVSPAVLIPRPETELVVERTLALLPADAKEMADLGTGSGAIALAVERRFDVVAANPPYIARGDTELAADVSRFEPEIALIAGATGLEAIEQIVAQAAAHLQPGGWLILEHGWTQAGAVRERLVRSGFAHVRSHADLAGHERVTEGSLP